MRRTRTTAAAAAMMRVVMVVVVVVVVVVVAMMIAMTTTTMMRWRRNSGTRVAYKPCVPDDGDDDKDDGKRVTLQGGCHTRLLCSLFYWQHQVHDNKKQ